MENKDGAIKFYKKLAKVRDAIDYIQKTGRNEFHKYNYATEADILEHVRTEFKNIGLLMTVQTAGITHMETLTHIGMQFTLIDLETGYSEFYAWYGSGEDKLDKGLYKGYTGAVKYFLMKMFMVPTGDDPEKDKDDKDKKPPKLPKGNLEETKLAISTASKEQITEIKKLSKTHSWTKDEREIIGVCINARLEEIKEGINQ